MQNFELTAERKKELDKIIGLIKYDTIVGAQLLSNPSALFEASRAKTEPEQNYILEVIGKIKTTADKVADVSKMLKDLGTDATAPQFQLIEELIKEIATTGKAKAETIAKTSKQLHTAGESQELQTYIDAIGELASISVKDVRGIDDIMRLGRKPFAKLKGVFENQDTTIYNLLHQSKTDILSEYACEKPAIETGIRLKNDSNSNDAQITFDAGRLNCFVAFTNVGKTKLTINFAVNAMKKGQRVLFISTEESPQNLLLYASNCIASECNATREHIKDYLKELALNDTTDYPKYEPVYNFVNEQLNDKIRFLHLPILDTETLCESLQLVQYEYDIVFIDYVQMLRAAKTYSKTDELADVMRLLNNTAVTTQLPIVLIAQFNRDAQNARLSDIGLTNIGNSIAIAQTCSEIYFVWACKEIDTDKLGGDASKMKGREKAIYNENISNSDFRKQLYIESVKSRTRAKGYYNFFSYDWDKDKVYF